MLEMSTPAIGNYELGNRHPNAKQLGKIAGALGISPFAIADPPIIDGKIGSNQAGA